MSSLTILGDTSGSVLLQAPAVAGSPTVTLPSSTGTLAINGPAFAAYPSTGVNISSNTNTKVTLNTELYDTNNCFDTSNSRFTPTVAGYYQINFTCNTSASNNKSYLNFNIIYKNGSAYLGQYAVFPAGNVQNYCGDLSQLIYMNGSTDYLEFYANVYVASGTPSISGGGGTSTSTLVSGYLARTA
jgi:hypothetical protein